MWQCTQTEATAQQNVTAGMKVSSICWLKESHMNLNWQNNPDLEKLRSSGGICGKTNISEQRNTGTILSWGGATNRSM